MTSSLPKLLDARGLAEELGLTYDQAWKIMRRLPTIRPPGLRKVYVRRADVEEYLLANVRESV